VAWQHGFWLVAVALLGGCVGSFLNVVIYRLSRGMSVHRPVRSFCPGCRVTIAWYDNIPILSYLMLRGRCRRCGMPISARYPLIEGVTILLFLLMYDAFFLGSARREFTALGNDWPVFVAHLVLLSALVVTSAIDIEGYWIDVTITFLVAAVGLVAHGLWTPPSSEGFPRPWSGTAAGVSGATIGLGVSALFQRLRSSNAPAEPVWPDSPSDVPPTETESERGGRCASTSGLAWAWLMPVVIAGWFVLTAIDADRIDAPSAFGLRSGLVILACFAMMVGAGMAPTQAEADIVEAIHQERSTARAVALAELVWLLPAIGLGVLAAMGAIWTHRGGVLWREVLAWAPLGGTWRPIVGVTTAFSGFVVAGAVGWCVRIVFTLLLGKEAFGLGDVHLMAAAGAVAGWPVVVMGFFLGCPLALAAVLIWLVRKRSRAVWFGPWLSLGVVVAMVSYRPIADRVGASLEVLGWLLGADR